MPSSRSTSASTLSRRVGQSKVQLLTFQPKPARVLQILGEMGAVDEQFLGHAAADHAGAADPIFLGDGDPRAMRGGDPRRAHAARAGADDEEVVIVGCGHGCGSSQMA